VIIDALPEAATVIRLMYMPLYLISGVIFPIWLLPESYVSLLLWNPYLHLIELLRENSIAYYPKVDQVNYFYPAVCAVLSLFIGMSLYRLRRLRLAAS
jgi:capsular polysaccharide transport system permease protein